MRQSVDLRKACCALRKLEPMQRLLQGHEAWITGLRREQSDHRSDVPFPRIDAHGRDKYYPLADWSLDDVWHYVFAGARRALQRPARPGLSQHRLPALHPRGGAGRGLPRRSLVVGTGRRQGVRPAQPAAAGHGLKWRAHGTRDLHRRRARAADLITVRGAQRLASADVVLFDALTDPALRVYAPKARWIDVGKRGFAHGHGAGHIDALLVQLAQEHAVVVRLKGGDPSVFGRLEEELLALQAAGMPCEVVPGVTAAWLPQPAPSAR
jgi:hypothetical protein